MPRRWWRRPARGFLIFASYANRLAVCDALSPVWLSDAAVGGAVMLGLAMLKLDGWKARLGAAALAGALVAGFHALGLAAIACQRLEGVSPEATRAVARPCAGGAALLSPRLADRDDGRGPAGHRPVRLGVAGLAGMEARADGRDLLRRTLAVALAGGGRLRAAVLADAGGSGGADDGASRGDRADRADRGDVAAIRRACGCMALAILLVLLGFGAAVPLAIQLVPSKNRPARR